MRREISSSTQTQFRQFVIVAVSILVFFVIAFNFSKLSEKWFVSLNYFFVLFSISFFVIRFFFRLKRVEITEKGLFISDLNFGYKEIFVPFEKIKSVSQSFLQRGNSETVTIELLENTKFGMKIRFAPEFRFFPISEHPIVEELNHKMAQYYISK